MPKLYVEEMCLSCISILMLHLPFYTFIFVGLDLKCEFIYQRLNSIWEYAALGTSVTFGSKKLIVTTV